MKKIKWIFILLLSILSSPSYPYSDDGTRIKGQYFIFYGRNYTAGATLTEACKRMMKTPSSAILKAVNWRAALSKTYPCLTWSDGSIEPATCKVPDEWAGSSCFFDAKGQYWNGEKWVIGYYTNLFTGISRYPCLEPERMPESLKSSQCNKDQITRNNKENERPLLCSGNPINIATGNKYQNIKILFNSEKHLLSYNSSNQEWHYSMSKNIFYFNSTAILTSSNNSKYIFSKKHAIWSPDADVFYSLIDLGASNPNRWQVITPEGDTELYNEAGKLTSITNMQGETTNLSYSDDGLTTTVTNHLGDELILKHNSQGNLINATLNNNLTHTFNFDAEGRLLNRTDPAGNITTYHYEDNRFPKHLTGITGPDNLRFASWSYDNQGRAISSEHAGQEKVELVFNDDGSTTVTNPLGKQTTYHFQTIEGLKRPVRVEGHATEHCIGANQAYTYYDSGLLKTKTDWQGNTTAYEYNDRGQITKIIEAQGTAQERITTQQWHPSLPLLLSRTRNNETETFIYNDTNQLIGTQRTAAVNP